MYSDRTVDFYTRFRECQKHQKCLNLGLVPVYSCHPHENGDYVDGVIGWTRGSEERALEKIRKFDKSTGRGEHPDDPILTGVEWSHYETGHWSSTLAHVEILVAVYGERP